MTPFQWRLLISMALCILVGAWLTLFVLVVWWRSPRGAAWRLKAMERTAEEHLQDLAGERIRVGFYRGRR